MKKQILFISLLIVFVFTGFNAAHVDARGYKIYWPERRVRLTIKYVDSETNQEIAPRVIQTNSYRRR